MRFPMLAIIGLSLLMLSLPTAEYDPLQRPVTPLPKSLELTVEDATRGRSIPVRVYLPTATTAAPVVLFSHGLGGSRDGNAFMGEHWSARGYLCVFLQHPGSDTGVWKDAPPAERMAAMRRAASVGNFALRVGDVPAVLDRLQLWQEEAGHVLAGRLDLTRIGMSGHSFGALTTQAVSGQAFSTLSCNDRRITAAIAFSPSSPRQGGDTAFAGVRLPWLLMTGTHDTSPIGDQSVASRLAVYAALPANGMAYELVLDRAEHSAFTDRALPGDSQPRNPNHHRAILAVSTAFWDAWLRGQGEARAWLDGDRPRQVLETSDRWQRK